ncbi:hypothetical protein G3I48_06490 [Streptomyces griseus]|uniref:hypothetical protein n=1 Tax=Streptomyces griseus TaxID=1911 RepID=UPI0013B71EA3|nr:hypothetical protein [Streptomyces griseus]
MPRELFEPILEACLTPLAAYLLHPAPEEGWAALSEFSQDWSLDLAGLSGWAMLARCPERWAELAAHPALGPAVQHLLLDQDEIQALEDARLRAVGADRVGEELPADPDPVLSQGLLLACLPALCLPELAELPDPQVRARRTLHHIAHRVHKNPRLETLAADQLRAATDALVTHGQLLSPPEKQNEGQVLDGRILRLAEDLALLNPDHLACLDQPAVVSPALSRTLVRIIANGDPDHDRLARLLERHSEHRRAEVLTALASNPHTPNTAVTDVLDGLHPAESAWNAERADGPGWFLCAAAAAPVSAGEDDGVLRLVSDDSTPPRPARAQARHQCWNSS